MEADGGRLVDIEGKLPQLRPMRETRKCIAKLMITTHTSRMTPESDIISEEGKIALISALKHEIVDVNKKEERRKHRTLRNTSGDGMPGSRDSILNHPNATIREKGTNPEPNTAGDVEWVASKFVENSIVPGRVEGFRDVEKGNGLMFVMFEGGGDDVLETMKMGVG